MKILFSNPPWWETQPDGTMRRGVRAGSRWPFSVPYSGTIGQVDLGAYIPYPFFLGAAATYAAKAGADVAFRDSIALRESYGDFYKHIRGQYDYIVIESATPSWEHDALLIREMKLYAPDAKIIVTGPIATLGEQLLHSNPIHAVIKGEYEKGVVAVMNGASGLLDFNLLTTAEMDAAPWPYMDETYVPLYFDSNPHGQRHPQAQVWSSRGCSAKCIFCVWPAAMTGDDPDGTKKRSVRQHSPERMEAMLTDWRDRFGFRSVYFDDDTFNIGDRHTLAMCDVMRRVKLPWSAMCRADWVKPDTWREMKESGCFGVKLGFESGNQEVVDKIVRKHLNLKDARRVVFLLKELGMSVHGTFTQGLPGETPAQVQDTHRYIASLPMDSYQLSGTASIEGTPLASLEKAGHLERYPLAQVDGNYSHQVDGQKKVEAMRR